MPARPIEIAADEAAPWVERLARIGFAAKGVLYVTIGALAVTAALGQGGRTGTDTREAMNQLERAPLGRWLLGVLALGLAGYALWRIIEGIHDPERRGRSAKGLAMRGSYVARGIVHLALAASAASVALWHRGGGGSGQNARHWSARALELPGGIYLLWVAAASFVGFGLYQLACAWKAKLDNQLILGPMSSRARRLVYGVSRFGIAARGIVFGTVGVLLAGAAMHHDPDESGGIADSMHRLVRLGTWPFFAIAVGVVAYGLYQFICARYRRIAVR